MKHESFASWAEVLATVKEKSWVLYHAPMDVLPTRVLVSRKFKNGKLRLDPMSNQADAFTADASHLSRFRKEVAS